MIDPADLYLRDIKALNDVRAFYGVPESGQVKIISRGQVIGPINSVLTRSGVQYAEVITPKGGLWVPINANVITGTDLKDDSSAFDRARDALLQNVENTGNAARRYSGFLNEAFKEESKKAFDITSKTAKYGLYAAGAFLALYAINTLTKILK
jgi:hypothetical protein